MDLVPECDTIANVTIGLKNADIVYYFLTFLPLVEVLILVDNTWFNTAVSV